jgi:hypothetical protein
MCHGAHMPLIRCHPLASLFLSSRVCTAQCPQREAGRATAPPLRAHLPQEQRHARHAHMAHTIDALRSADHGLLAVCGLYLK